MSFLLVLHYSTTPQNIFLLRFRTFRRIIIIEKQGNHHQFAQNFVVLVVNFLPVIPFHVISRFLVALGVPLAAFGLRPLRIQKKPDLNSEKNLLSRII